MIFYIIYGHITRLFPQPHKVPFVTYQKLYISKNNITYTFLDPYSFIWHYDCEIYLYSWWTVIHSFWRFYFLDLAKFIRRYRNFLYTSGPMHAHHPLLSVSPTRVIRLLQLMNQHWNINHNYPNSPLFTLVKWVKVSQSCPTLCEPMDYTVHGILQARILEWVTFPSPGDLPNPGIEPSLLHCRQILYQLSHQGRPHGDELV